MSALAEQNQEHWRAIGPLLRIRNDRDYTAATERLNALLDEIGDDEGHPFYDFLDTLGTVIHAYEEDHVVLPEADGIGALEYLIEEHGLEPADLRELGSPADVRAVLEKKRELRLDEIRALAKRFGVSPAVFV